MDHHDKLNFEEITKFIKDDSVVVDVGAHIGGYCDFFLEKLGESGKIYALEIHPKNYARLYNKYKLLNNLYLIHKAASNNDGVEDVYHNGSPGHTQTTNILGKNTNEVSVPRIGSIQSIKLDTLLHNENSIDLVKIDVEGAEIKVLEGLSKIHNRINHLLIECHFDKDWDRIKDLLLNEYNFLCYDLSDKNNIDITTDKRAYQCLCKKKII